MNLAKKKILASKVLKVGKNRVVFSSNALSDIKEAITKQDIKILYDQGIIKIKPIKGRKKIIRRLRRGPGKIKKKVNKRKQIYVKLTRKLRAYVKYLRDNKAISRDIYLDLRKKIRGRYFKSKANLKEFLKNVDIVDSRRVKNKTKNKYGKGTN